MARTGVVGNLIKLGIKFYLNGDLVDPYYVGAVNIYDSETGGNIIDTIVPNHTSVGFYQAYFNCPSDLATGEYFDEWTWEAEADMGYKVQRYSFTITSASTTTVEETGEEAVSVEIVKRNKPSWIYHVGLREVEDLGNGMGVSLNWREAEPASYRNNVHYNIYYADTRFGVFEEWPKAITLQTYGTVNIPPGNLYFFGVRATEFNIINFNISELEQVSSGVYAYPTAQILLADIDAYGNNVMVSDTSGFPSKGYLQIEYEVMYYTSKTDTYFVVLEENRGAYTTPNLLHLSGVEVKLFKGVEDGNTIMVNGTAAWTEDNGPPRNVNEIGEFNVDEDGYRTNAEDIITTDLSASDANTIDFPNYDYCGYHRPSMQAYFKGECLNSYAWGTLNGLNGVGLQDQNLSRLDMMLQTTGEPVILLRKKQTGKRCRCIDLRREHPRARCVYCFDTGFEGGFDRYINPRAISEFYTNSQGMILIRVQPFEDDLKLDSAGGIMQASELTAWTINVPTIKDFDRIIRFTEDGQVEFIYECLNVVRNKLMFGLTGQQTMRLKRLDKTSIIYSFDYTI